MRALVVFAAAAVAAASLVSDTVAGGPPVANETVHFNDAAFSDVGHDCATGNESVRTVTFSGVLHTRVMPDGSSAVRGSFRGATTFDDLPADGTPDATASFRRTIGEMVLPNGGVEITEIWNGTTTATGGAELRFHITYQLRLDPAGNVTVEVFRFTCD